MARLSIFSVCVIPLIIAACAAPQGAATAEPTKVEPAATVKPGAALSFSHALRAPVEPGGSGVLQLTIRENYGDGAMRLEASSDGLELAGASRATTLSMSGGDMHHWDIYFDAPDGGIYYIDILGAVDAGEGGAAMRSYSARVQIGDDASFAKPSANTAMDAAGVPVIAMDAEETIED